MDKCNPGRSPFGQSFCCLCPLWQKQLKGERCAIEIQLYEMAYDWGWMHLSFCEEYESLAIFQCGRKQGRIDREKSDVNDQIAYYRGRNIDSEGSIIRLDDLPEKDQNNPAFMIGYSHAFELKRKTWTKKQRHDFIRGREAALVKVNWHQIDPDDKINEFFREGYAFVTKEVGLKAKNNEAAIK